MIVKQHRSNANPVNGVEKALPKQGAKPKHHAALPWADMPAPWLEIAGRDGMGKLAQRFTVLTAALSGEIRGARWSEIDLEARMWTVPAEREGKGEHRVPLSEAAVEVLRAIEGMDADLVFLSTRQGKMLSDMTLAAVLKRMDVPVTVHGFRSTFRGWCNDRGGVQREIAEAALAHQLTNKVESAYSRFAHFEKRRVVMDRWAAYCTGGTGNVVARNA